MGIFKLESSEILLPFPVLTPRGLHPALIEAIISRGESPIEKQDFREKFSLSDISSNIPLPGLRYLFLTEGKVGHYKIALIAPPALSISLIIFVLISIKSLYCIMPLSIPD